MAKLKPSSFRQQIERYLDNSGWDVTCRKRNDAYNLVWADDQTLLARFKPTGRGDEVEIFWWDGDRWQDVGEFGCVLPLHEALNFVFEDPEGLFFDDDVDEDRAWSPGPRRAIADLFSSLVVSSTVAGCLAGFVSTPVFGMAVGAIVAYLMFAIRLWHVFPWVVAFRFSAVLAGPAVFAAAVGGTLGAALNEAVVTVWWGRFAGVLIGGLCGLVIYASRPLGWLLSTLAGIVLGISLTAVLGITQLHCVCLITALLAASFGRFSSWMGASPVVAIGGEALSEDVQREGNQPASSALSGGFNGRP